MILLFLFSHALANFEPKPAPWMIGPQHDFEMNYMGKQWFCKHQYIQSPERDLKDTLSINCIDSKKRKEIESSKIIPKFTPILKDI